MLVPIAVSPAARFRSSAAWPSGVPTGYQQRYWWPGVSASRNGGISSPERSWAEGQRGADREARGGLMRLGGGPMMASSRLWLVFSRRGIDFFSASVYGIFMSAKRARVG